jgi:hypothetical protein
MEDQTKLESEEVLEPSKETVLTPDWTESEWFNEWLTLARGRRESAGVAPKASVSTRP